MSGQGYQVGKGFTVGAAIANPPSNYTFTFNPTTTGGSLGGVYYACITWVNSYGETIGSKEQNTTVTGSTGTISIQPAAISYPVGATACNVYVGTASGQESYQGQITSPGAAFILTSAPVIGKPVPQWNTTAYADVNPSALGLSVGSEFIVHDIYYNNPIAFGVWDSTTSTLVMFDGDTGNGAKMDLAIHCNGSQWLRLYNQNQYTQLQTSFDGMQTV